MCHPKMDVNLTPETSVYQNIGETEVKKKPRAINHVSVSIIRADRDRDGPWNFGDF